MSKPTSTYVIRKTFLKESKNSDGFKKFSYTIPIYGSGLHGEHIRNAVTGKYTEHKIGSNDEHQYFKVIMGSIPNVGRTVTLFYSSPEEYKEHQMLEDVNKEIIDNWRYKKQQYGGVLE